MKTRGAMSGINRFLSRRDKNRSGSRQRKVTSPSPLPPLSPAPLSLDGQCASSCTEGLADCFPSRSSHSSFSLHSLHSISLAFPDMIAGKASPYLQATETLVHASTANSLDRYILQPGLPSDQFFGLFTADKKTPPGKDEKAKVRC